MKTCNSILILLLLASLSTAEEDGFSRYQLILDKKIFGQEPPEADMKRIQSSESFARNVRLSMLFQGPDGDISAGIVDSSDPSGEHSYIIHLGESVVGFELVEADITKSQALIRRGEEIALFKLESGNQEQPAQQQPVPELSYAERRRKRLEAAEARAREQNQAPAVPALTGEALRKHLEQVQMDAIRNGLPPLPMQLTPEMDAQLVAEGVLPPQNDPETHIKSF
jgi:hypothetical protein